MTLRELFTGTKPSTCKKYAGNPSQLGKSARDSCKSQGLIARSSKKKHKLGKTIVKIDGKKIKGQAHGGPLPDYNKKG